MICFISVASYHNKKWLAKMLNSIPEKYRCIKHCIIDVGNFDLADHIFLHKNCEIKKANITPVNSAQVVVPTFAANHCYPYFNKIFPQYEIFLHIEPDVTIIEGCVFEKLIEQCLKQGISFADKYNRGLFCIDSKSGYFEKWQKKYEENASNKYWHQGKIIESIYLEEQLKDLNEIDDDFIHNQMIFHKGLPVLYNNKLCEAKTLKKISSTHMHAECFARYKIESLPIIKIDGPMNDEMLKKHLEYSKEFLMHGTDQRALQPRVR